MVGENSTTADAAAEAVISFETDLAAIFIPKDQLRDPMKNYNKVEFAELRTMVSSIAWGRYLGAIGAPESSQSKLVVENLQYMQDLDVLLSNTELKQLQYYLTWHALNQFGSKIHEDFTDMWLEYASVLYGISQLPPRWESCVASTVGNLGFALGRLFIDERLPEETLDEALEMVEAIRTTFEASLDTLPWLDAASAATAREKAEAVIEKIGYPSWVRDDAALLEHYEGLEVGALHFSNSISSIKSSNARSMARFEEPVDKTRWYMNPSEVNAYYSPSFNQIVFPAGILQPPFFAGGVGKAFNYGAIGSVIAHELTHGFDDQGRMYDKDGQLTDGGWMSPESSRRFNDTAQCFVQQYNEFTVNTESVNGKLTLGENIADNGGLAGAYAAYAKSVAAAPPLPGLGLTNNQLFFVSFGQVWCGMARPEKEHMWLLTDVHSPRKARVVGSTQNSKDFSDAFGCSASAAMNPKEKCLLW